MRITQEADYAIRICCHLATVGEGVSDAGTVAESAVVPPRFTLKILRKLAKEGIVQSKKGATGGYMLAVDPRELTVLNVIEAIDGDMAISRCISAEQECSRNPKKSNCKMHNIFCCLNSMLATKLDMISVCDIATDEDNLKELIKKVQN